MNIYEKNLSGTDEIFSEIKAITDRDNLGNKIQIVRMYTAAEEVYENGKIKDKLIEKAGNDQGIVDIIVIDDQSGILLRKAKLTDDKEEKIYYQPVCLGNGNCLWFGSLDEALIGLVCMKHDSDCVKWISRMIGIKNE